MREDDEARIGRQVSEAYRRAGTPSSGARDRLLEGITRLPRPRRAWVGWIWGGFGMGPAGVAAAAAVVLVAAGTITLRTLGPGPGVPVGATAPAPRADAPMVRFELAASGAAQVTLVGDFNGWDRQATPMRRAEAAGVWTVSVPLARGRHAYGFVIDGVRWVPDPAAPLAPADGFGGVNSVIIVGGPGSS